MEQKLYNNYVTILRHELVPALGCTEPIAVAYCAAVAAKTLGNLPDKADIYCSGNVIKNVKSVTVPNSGGMRGIEAAAVLGMIGGNPDKKLEVLESVTDADREAAAAYLKTGKCRAMLQVGEENLYVRCELFYGEDSAIVELKKNHDHISRIEKNGQVLFDAPVVAVAEAGDKFLMSLQGIYEFASTCCMEDVQETIARQISSNRNLAEEGLSHLWGANVGKNYLQYNGKNVRSLAIAMAAAGSDARMSGCSLPAVINSGSGNQGITVSMPVIVYGDALGVSRETLYRALVLANLISIHQKKYIGNLSCYCGAVSAATGAACGIAFLKGDSYDILCDTVTNSVATIGGMICDGAKESCAGKIRSAVDTALFALEQAENNATYQPGEGIVGDDVEQTICNIGRVGRVGMAPTDVEVLHIMTAE